MTKRLYLWLVLGLLPLTLCAVSIRAVQHRAFTTADFERIADYAGWEAFDGRYCLRSNPQKPDGHYFVIRLDRKLRELPERARIELEYFLADSPEVQRFTANLAPLAEKSKRRRVYLGLTEGGALPLPTTDNPLTAYRIQVFAGDGTEPLAVHASFLWRAPESTPAQ
ncbi:MAG: hypothetical protein ACFB20_08620 [Opitutales bacterium]